VSSAASLAQIARQIIFDGPRRFRGRKKTRQASDGERVCPLQEGERILCSAKAGYKFEGVSRGSIDRHRLPDLQLRLTQLLDPGGTHTPFTLFEGVQTTSSPCR
jgi:hypothetical protein